MLKTRPKISIDTIGIDPSPIVSSYNVQEFIEGMVQQELLFFILTSPSKKCRAIDTATSYTVVLLAVQKKSPAPFALKGTVA